MAQTAEVAEEFPARSRWPEGLAALGHRNFALFFNGAVLSNSGAWMQLMAVPWVALQLTDSAVAVSVVSFFVFVPILVMGPLGGSLADRFDRRRLLLWAQVGQAVLALALGLTWLAGVRSLVVISLLVAAHGLVNGVSIPSWQAFVSELVPRRALLSAVTLNSAQFNASKAIGPAIGGFVLWRFGAGTAFLLNGVSYITVVVALLLIRLPRRTRVPVGEGDTVWRSFHAALAYGRGRPGILACFIVVSALGGFGSPFMQLLPVFARDVYAVGDREYGLLNAAMGIGALVALPVLTGGAARRARRRHVVSWAMVAYGLSMLVFGTLPSYAGGLAALLVAGGGYLALASALNTTIQLQVDETMRGKVLAVYVMLLTASLPAGLLLQAGVLLWAGPQLTVILFGVAFLAVLVWLELGSTVLAHLDDTGAVSELPAPGAQPV
jgi:MFS family permease